MSDQLLKYLEDICKQKLIIVGKGKTLIKQKSVSSIIDKILQGAPVKSLKKIVGDSAARID